MDSITLREREAVSIFRRACDLRGDARARFLDTACETDRTLRARVDALLAARSDSADAVSGESVAGHPLRIEFDPALSNESIVGDRYELVSELGTGSFGRVWQAWDKTNRGWVALKILYRWADSAKLETRARHEVQLQFGIRHANVVRVLDAGHDSKLDIHFIVMELCCRSVDEPERAGGERPAVAVGSSLWTDALHDGAFGAPRYTPRDVVSVMCEVCEGVAEAHRKGRAHGDISPGNVLIAPSGADETHGPAMVADFGFARHNDDADDGVLGGGLGTPGFAAPERAEGPSPQTDIFSLGALMYFLLEGERPYRSTGQTDDEAHEIAERIRDGEPPRSFTRNVPPALRGICLKSMASREEDRYRDVTSLQVELQAYLAFRPTSFDTSWRTRVALAYRRSRAPIHVGSLALVIIVVATVLYLTSLFNKNRQLEQRRVAALTTVVNAHIDQGRRQLVAGDLLPAMWYLVEALREAEGEEISAVPTRVLLGEVSRRLPLMATIPFNDDIADMRVDDGGDRVVVRTFGGSVRCFSAETGEEICAITTDGVDHIDGFDLSPTGDRVVTFSWDEDYVRLWDAETGTPIAETIETGSRVRCVRMARFDELSTFMRSTERPSVRCFATGHEDGIVRIWSAIDGAAIWNIPLGHAPINGLEFSPDGTILAVWGGSGHLGFFECNPNRTGATIHELFELGTSASGRFSSDGSIFAAIHAVKVVSLWNARSGTGLALLSDLEDIGRDPVEVGPSWLLPPLAAPTADGKAVLTARLRPVGVDDAAAGRDPVSLVVRWDVATRASHVLETVPDRPVAALACSPDGRLFAVGGEDPVIRVYRQAWQEPLLVAELHGHQRTVESLVFAQRGDRLVSMGADRTVRVWDTSEEKIQVQAMPEPLRQPALAVSADGHRAVVEDGSGAPKLVDVRTRNVITLAGHRGPIDIAAFSPDGALVATGATFRERGREARIIMWDAESGERIGAIEPGLFKAPEGGWSGSWNSSMAFSHDGQHLTIGVQNMFGLVFDAHTLEQRGVVAVASMPPPRTRSTKQLLAMTSQPLADIGIGHDMPVPILTAGADGATVVSAGFDASVRLWDVDSGTLQQTLTGPHRYSIDAVAINASGTRCVAADKDLLACWEIAPSGATLLWSRRRPTVTALAFSQQGLLAAGCSSGAVSLHAADNGRLLLERTLDDGAIRELHFTPDGATVTALTTAGRLRQWHIQSERRTFAELLRFRDRNIPLRLRSGALEENVLVFKRSDRTVARTTLGPRLPPGEIGD